MLETLTDAVREAGAHATRAKNLAQAGLRAASLTEGATPHEVVWTSGPVALRRYRPAQPAQGAAPLVFVMPFINRFRVVDLEPETSLVGRLVARGLEVFLVDWGVPTRLDASTDFEDFVLRFIPRAISSALDLTGATRADLMGLCLGGTLSVIHTAVKPERVRRLVTLVAPVDFSDMDLLSVWTREETFPVEALTRAFGNMPGHLVNQGFQWQRPVATALKWQKTWPKFEQPAFANFFAVVEAWSQDGADVPGAAYRRLIGDLYRRNLLAKGELRLRPHGAAELTVDLKRIECPVLVAAAGDDIICPSRAALALLEKVGTPAAQKKSLALKGGHITPLVGPKARASLQEPLADWLLAPAI